MHPKTTSDNLGLVVPLSNIPYSGDMLGTQKMIIFNQIFQISTEALLSKNFIIT